MALTDPGRQRVALVTGGAVRLGRAISLGLADAGYDVVVGYRSSSSEALEVKERVEAMGRRCVLVQGDLAHAGAPEALVSAAASEFGALHLLVNSAASFRTIPLEEVDPDEWDAVMNLNVRAPHLTVRAAAHLLREARGSVVNITDLSAFQAWAEYPHHAVSKAALAHLTRIQARALAPEIRVNAIAPGAVLPPDDWAPERWDALARRAPLKRVGSPGDVVRAVLYLAEAEFVTGHVLPVDGGRLLGPSAPPSASDDETNRDEGT
ncbi:MAG: SDR family oxidoreductase [Gemmatimonadetes bacterium]|nr:SDR family oxidoreductase [Gemmatimonadota bacterium]